MSDLIQALNSYQSFLSFKKTEQLQALLKLGHKIIGLFSGNQGGKTSSVAYQYFLRVIGLHPIKDKNRLAKKIRCISSSLPESTSADEQDNAQYTELKKFIPPELILKDITARSQNLVVRSPTHGKTIFEFRSSKQELQDLGKIQLSSVWHDEETPKAIREECKMRLLAENGDEIFSLTPVNALSWTFNDVWQQADYVFRTKTICDKFGFQQEEHRNTGMDIACIQMATDDNPTLSAETIERIFADVTDPDMLELRRYGVFKQITGRVVKSYNPSICYLPMSKVFPDGIPEKFIHGRGIDYHESRIPWSIGWLSVSPRDEWFLWKEFHPAIDGVNAYNTFEIAKAIARKSGDYEYKVNLIDPLANKKQPNTLFSATDDLNRHFNQIRQEDGFGTPCYWEGWNTKGTTGRDEVGKRFKNAVRCGKPFNNRYKEHGTTKYLPTLWIMNTCPKFNKSLIDWCYGEYVNVSTKAVNDPKSRPQPKNSHDNMVLEAFAKDHRLLHAKFLFGNNSHFNKPQKMYSVTGR